MIGPTIPDMVQQVEHGVLQQLAQVHAFGHPIVGIQSAWLTQYTLSAMRLRRATISLRPEALAR